MEAEIRWTASELGRRLLEHPERFTFMQAVRLLALLGTKKPEERDRFIADKIRMRPWLSLAFPANDIDNLHEENDGSIDLTITSFGLYGTLGALPTFYTDELMEEARQDEDVSRGFLDILNNHLYHLLYEADNHYRLERRIAEEHDPRFSNILFCLCGAPSRVFNSPRLPVGSMVEFLSSRYRSANHLRLYLSIMFARNDIEIEQCIERWTPVPREQRCLLGIANAALGDDAVLGSEIKDSMGRFRIHFMHVTEEELPAMLPGGAIQNLLLRRVKNFLTMPLEYDLVLHPDFNVEARRRLGKNTPMGFFLGVSDKPYALTIPCRRGMDMEISDN